MSYQNTSNKYKNNHSVSGYRLKFRQILLISTTLSMISGCNALSRLADVGSPPKLSNVQNPIHQEGYQPISMPTPTVQQPKYNPNSLWRAGSRSFFKDLRANEVGDIVTVLININDNANFNNRTDRDRENTETLNVPALGGYQAALGAILPEAANPASLLNITGELDQSGNGRIQRAEVVNLRVAAVVTQVLPNGNMVLHGRQETRVNYEVRELLVAGVVSPRDISSLNQVSAEDIAELRMSYGGRGQLTDLQQPRYGSQIIDIVLPF